jgi:WD40 repeat protein
VRTLHHGGSVECLAYALDGIVLASAGGYGGVRLWDLSTGRVRRVDAAAHRLAVAPDAGCLAVTPPGAVSGDVRLHHLRADTQSRLLSRHPARLMTFTPDGATLGVAGFQGLFDHGLTLWDVAAARPLRTVPEVGYGLAFGHGSDLLASGGRDLGVHLWSRTAANTWAPLAVLHGHRRLCLALAFSPDDRFLVSVTDSHNEESCEVRVWDVAAWEERTVHQGPPGPQWSITLSADASALAWTETDQRVVRLWDVARGQPRGVYDWKIGCIQALALSPDGMTAAVAGEVGDILVWDVI